MLNIDLVLSERRELIDYDALVDIAAEVLLQRILVRFLAEVSPEGQQWVPSHAAMRRAAAGILGGTLYDTGRLFRSLHIERPASGVRTITTAVPYASKHQNGTDGMVRRSFMGANPDDLTILHAALHARLPEIMQNG